MDQNPLCPIFEPFSSHITIYSSHDTIFFILFFPEKRATEKRGDFFLFSTRNGKKCEIQKTKCETLSSVTEKKVDHGVWISLRRREDQWVFALPLSQTQERNLAKILLTAHALPVSLICSVGILRN